MFPLEGRSVADIGCGSGRWLLEFAQWEASEIHGIELDEVQLERAKDACRQQICVPATRAICPGKATRSISFRTLLFLVRF